jgi:hypothetical protein
MDELSPQDLENDLALEGYGAVIVVAEDDGSTTSHYLPFSQANELSGILRRGTYKDMPVIGGARSTGPTDRRSLDLMKNRSSTRKIILGYVKNEPEFPAPLDVLYKHRGRIWRRDREGRITCIPGGVEALKQQGLFIPSYRRFTINLADRHEFAFGLLPEIVVVDRKPGILRTIRQGLEYDGLPPAYYSKLRAYLHSL